MCTYFCSKGNKKRHCFKGNIIKQHCSKTCDWLKLSTMSRFVNYSICRYIASQLTGLETYHVRLSSSMKGSAKHPCYCCTLS